MKDTSKALLVAAMSGVAFLGTGYRWFGPDGVVLGFATFAMGVLFGVVLQRRKIMTQAEFDQ